TRWVERTKVDVRAGRGSYYEVVDTLLKGEQVEIVQTEGGWVTVRTPREKVGWVFAAALSAKPVQPGGGSDFLKLAPGDASTSRTRPRRAPRVSTRRTMPRPRATTTPSWIGSRATSRAVRRSRPSSRTPARPREAGDEARALGARRHRHRAPGRRLCGPRRRQRHRRRNEADPVG